MLDESRVQSTPKVGVLLVGALGMTGSAVLAGICAMKAGRAREKYGATGHSAFAGCSLVSAGQMELGGWDYWEASLAQKLSDYGHVSPEVQGAVKPDSAAVMPGIWTELDFPLADGQGRVRKPTSLAEGARLIQQDINNFRSQTSCDRIVVVYLGSPSRDLAYDPGALSLDLLHDRIVPSGVMYALGAIEAGAHFVDFTPSHTLEHRDLWRYAESKQVQLAGRDGSTGQTMMKVTVAEMLQRRGITIDAWFSTNLIGNRDGMVLSQPAYASAKFADKTDALAAADVGFHMVTISYCPPWGDAKEAWDAVECTSWLGAPLSLRVNWRGHDSQLAGALVLDLVRLIDLGASLGSKGLQPQLGFFFKRPFEREHTTISERWAELIEVYAGHNG